MRVSSKLSRLANLFIASILLITLVVVAAGWYQPSTTTSPGEQTSKYLPPDTDAYFSFNLLPGLSQSVGFTHFLSFFKDDILTMVNNFDPAAHDILKDNNLAGLIGPELALATFDYGTSKGLVLFVQIPSGKIPEDVRDLVIHFMDTAFGGKQTQLDIGGGIIEINRSVNSEFKIEYYTTQCDGTDCYVLGALGNVSLVDFQTLNTGVSNGTWPAANLSANVDFVDLQNNLPAVRMGLGYMNGSQIRDCALNVFPAVDPYLSQLDLHIYGISVRNASDYILNSPLYDVLGTYIPDYAGLSVRSLSDGLETNFYSPDTSYPFASGVTNSLSTAGLIPNNALAYGSDVNMDVWWSTVRPILVANSSDWVTLVDDLAQAGLTTILGFNTSALLNLALDSGLDENVFNWSTGEFALSHLPYSSNAGKLFVLDVADYGQATAKIGDITTALANASMSGVEYQFTAGNTSLLLGWPAGVINDALSRWPLQNYTLYQQMTSSYLPTLLRGILYYDTAAPLKDAGASYYIGSAEGSLVLRVSPPMSGGVSGGGGGGRSLEDENLNFYLFGNLSTSGYVNIFGKLVDDVVVSSLDGEVTIHISRFTVLLDSDGDRILDITVDRVASPPAAPQGYTIIAAYDFKPDGVTFDPEIEITITYDPNVLPQGADEEKLAIAFYNEGSGQWEIISGTVDPSAHTITFSINHFTTFSVLAAAAEPTPTPSPTPTPTAPSGGIGPGAWAGIIIGIIAVILIAAWFLRERIFGWRFRTMLRNSGLLDTWRLKLMLKNSGLMDGGFLPELRAKIGRLLKRQ